LQNQTELVTNGIPGVLGPDGFSIAWVQYQQLMVHKLNEFTAGTNFENAETKAIVIQSARQPEYARIFNFASMAFNNHFFFEGLNTSETPSPIPNTLETRILQDFGSIETLRQEMIGTAYSMFGPGFVWLVKVQTGASRYSMRDQSLRILTTYNAGSPLSGAHYRRQPVDMNTQTPPTSGSLSNEEFLRQNVPQNQVGYMGRYSTTQSSPLAPGGADLEPLLCVNTWEHVWLRDWGIFGKEDYLQAWWKQINWDMVAFRANLQTSMRGSTGRQPARPNQGAEFMSS